MKQDWSVLPPHLQDRIRESFAEVGRGLVLRSPFLGFDQVFRTMEIVLPAQSGRLASPDTCWRVQNRRYSARSETRIPLSELDNANAQISLCDLNQGFDDQSFQVDTRLGETVPFRVFRKDTGRERILESYEDVALPFGAYVVITSPDVRTNEEEYVFETDGYRGIEVDLRPGDDPLSLSRGEQRWQIRAALQPGIYVDREKAETALLEDGDLLHYGGDLGLVAYFPAEESDESSFKLAVICDEQQLNTETEIAATGSNSGVYRFQDNLQQPIARALDRLPPGIHRLKLSLSTSSGRIDHSFWYWKGLEQISEAFGFRCRERPANLDINRSRGLKETDRGIVFKPGYHAPVVTLALDRPPHVLELPRAGVQALVMEAGGDWEEETNPSDPLVVSPSDKRVLRFRSGGFERWEIVGNDRPFAVLDRNHTSVVKSLTGLASECGGSGRIYAQGEDKKRILLVSFTRPLTASAPQYELDHTRRVDVWRFRIPVAEMHDLGASITELTDEPIPAPGEIVTIAKRIGDTYDTVEHQIDGGTIVITTKHTGPAPDQSDRAGDSPGVQREDSTWPTAALAELRVEVVSRIEALTDRIWAIDFSATLVQAANRVPLDSVERHGYSTLRIFAWDKHDLRKTQRGGDN